MRKSSAVRRKYAPLSGKAFFALSLIVIFMAPLAWMLLISLKSPQQIANRPQDLLPTTLRAEVDGRKIEVEIVSRAQSPVVAVRHREEDWIALIPKNDWSRLSEADEPTQFEIIERLEDPETEYVLVRPTESTDGSESLILKSDEIGSSLHLRFENYPKALREIGGFTQYLANTVFVCLMQIIGQLVAATIAAYGFTLIDWRGREKMFSLMLMTLMIPFPVLMIPLYDQFRSLDWLGTLKPLWVPAMFASAFNVFLLRQFFLTLPRSIIEAARLDGCSDLRIIWSVVAPLSRPILTTVALFQFLFAWNDFLGPLIFLTDQSDYTVSLALQFFQSQHGGSEWNLLMAASVVTAAPIAVLFFFAQRFLIGGMSMGGMR